jgi:hypothetical protein
MIRAFRAHCQFCREQLQQFAFAVGYEPVPSACRAMVSRPTDDAGVELDALAEIKPVRSPSGANAYRATGGRGPFRANEPAGTSR